MERAAQAKTGEDGGGVGQIKPFKLEVSAHMRAPRVSGLCMNTSAATKLCVLLGHEGEC